MESFPKDRVLYSWMVKKNPTTSEEYLQRTRIKKSPPPFNFTIVKGIVYCSFSRKFIEYALFNEYAKSLLEWSKDTYSMVNKLITKYLKTLLTARPRGQMTKDHIYPYCLLSQSK